jgi:hypothetical protein
MKFNKHTVIPKYYTIIARATMYDAIDVLTSLFLFFLFQIGLPTADLDCDLAQYADIICGKSYDKFLYNVAFA